MLAQAVTDNHQTGQGEGALRHHVDALKRLAQRPLQILDPFLGDHDLSGQLKLQPLDSHAQVGSTRGLREDLAEQFLLPVRQAEDFLSSRRATNLPRIRRSLAVDAAHVGAQDGLLAEVLADPAVSLQVTANPFDFWPLIERGFAEWSRTSDALIDGAPVKGALDLFRRGLRDGVLDLFLWGVSAIEEGLSSAVPDHKSFLQDLGLDRLVDQGTESGPLDPPIPGENSRVNPFRIGAAQQPSEPLLYDIVSVFHGYLQGHLLWVAPEYRGRGLVGQYFDAALAVARWHGLKGFMFLSTLPFWERRAPRYGFEARGCIRQPSGPDVIGWFREVC